MPNASASAATAAATVPSRGRDVPIALLRGGELAVERAQHIVDVQLEDRLEHPPTQRAHRAAELDGDLVAHVGSVVLLGEVEARVERDRAAEPAARAMEAGVLGRTVF